MFDVRGLYGGGRSRSRTGLHSQIPCEQGKEQGILQTRGLWRARDFKYCRRCRASDANSLLNKTGNYFSGAGNSGARTGNFAWQKSKSSPDEVFGTHRARKANTMKRPQYHVHFNSRREANPVFHMTDKLIKAAMARRPDLSGKIRVTSGWDLGGFSSAMKTANMFVTSVQIPRENLRETAPSLSAIHCIGAGIEYLRPFDWVPKGIEIINNRGIHRQKAGEYILMCLLMLHSRIPMLMNAQSRRKWLPLFTDHIKEKTVVIVGVGHLGGAGAQQAKRLGLHVIGVRRSGRPHRYCDEVVSQDGLHEVLPRADFIVVTAPSTPATDGMIGEREFGLMKNTAGFMNFARARLVDYQVLMRSLRKRALSGAILDVFDPEPLPRNSNLWTTPNLLITPHCSSDDLDRYIPMTLDLVFNNVARALVGRKLVNRIDIRRQY
jgi:phosphoglycerate dehydrogenase-like enzyme